MYWLVTKGVVVVVKTGIIATVVYLAIYYMICLPA